MSETGLMADIEQVRKTLLARQEELKTALRQNGENSLDAGSEDVQDEIDRVTTLEAKTASLELSTREFKALEDVRAALQRLDEGTYGRCIVDDEPIGEARLKAIPETPYCIRHAEEAEAETKAHDDASLLNS